MCGTKRALLIDTGLGVANIKEVVDKLTMLPIFVVTTHVHWDHIGGHQYWCPHFGERLDIREVSDIAAAGEKESDLPGVSVSRRI